MTPFLDLVTTLLDPVAYPKEALMALYRDRWLCELDLRHLKVSMQMDVLRGMSPNIVRKEFWAHLLAYNLLRGLMGQAASQGDVPARRLSVKGTLQRLSVLLPRLLDASYDIRQRLLDHLSRSIADDVLPDRPNRVEPRARKRRPKPYPLLTMPRAVARRKAVG